MTETEAWRNIAKRKQADRDALIPNEWRLPSSSLPTPDTTDVTSVPRTCGILTEQELDITSNYDATALAQAISTRKLTSYAVTLAFCKRAAIAHQLTNCLTEILFTAALRRAEYLDHHLARTGSPVGPLHGVPVSVKDSFKITGYDSSIGIATFCYKPAVTSSPLVSLLISAGAVIHCKTNVPQTLMALDSINNVFGRTLNPAHLKLTAGGSSGGEGALIAMRGSVLGVGTDIGGSIRIPAMCNGLYGIKPSAGRVPYADQEQGTMPGMGVIGLQSSAGPIAVSLRDCDFFMRAVSAGKPWLHDPYMFPATYDSTDLSVSGSSASAKPLTIAILYTDGITTPLPPITNLLHQVSAALTSAGHTILPLTSPPATLKTAQTLANAFFSLEGYNTMLSHLNSTQEPLVPWMSTRLRAKPPGDLAKAASLQAQREKLMTDMLSVWRTPSGGEVDALICPVAPHPLPEIDRWNTVSYTSTWVLFDYPAGTVPVRTFEEADLEGDIEGAASSNWDKRNRELWDKEKTDRRVYLSTPMCVQVVAPRLQEKRLVRAMEAVDNACKVHLKKDATSGKPSQTAASEKAKL